MDIEELVAYLQLIGALRRIPGVPPVTVGLRGMSEEFATIGTEVTAQQAAEEYGAIMVGGSPRGGIRIPHLHFGSTIRILNEEQWNQFAKKALDKMSEKLANAKTVSFEQMNELADAVSTIS